MFGGALGLAVLATLATSRTNSDLKHLAPGVHSLHVAQTSGFQLAFAIAAGFALLGAVVALFGLPRVGARPTAAVAADQPPAAQVELS